MAYIQHTTEIKMNQKITVTYWAAGRIEEYGESNEHIQLSVEINNFDDYPDTLELLRSKVLDKLNLKQKHDQIQSDYEDACKRLERKIRLIEKAQKDWEVARNFMISQGLKSSNDVAEFPQEALTNLTKSLPTDVSGYPE